MLQSTHTLTKENKRQHVFDAAFKLKAIELAFMEGNTAAVHQLGINEGQREFDYLQNVPCSLCICGVLPAGLCIKKKF